VTFAIPPHRLGEFFTFRDFRELAEYYACDPWGQQRDDLRTAQLCALVAAAFAGKGKRPVPADFMHFQVPRKLPDMDQLGQKLIAFARAKGAK
jgi:hypothetical protein